MDFLNTDFDYRNAYLGQLIVLPADTREAGSVAVLPRRYAPMGSGSIPSPGPICAFGFQSILASAGFFRVLRFSLLHLKLDFLNKSVSKHYIDPLNLTHLH